MSQEHTAFVIPAGLKINQTDDGLVIENEHDVIIRGSLGSNIYKIHSLRGDIIVDIETELREICADNGCVRFERTAKAHAVQARSVIALQDLVVDRLSVTAGAVRGPQALWNTT